MSPSPIGENTHTIDYMTLVLKFDMPIIRLFYLENINFDFIPVKFPETNAREASLHRIRSKKYTHMLISGKDEQYGIENLNLQDKQAKDMKKKLK